MSEPRAPSPYRMLGLGLEISLPVLVFVFVGYKVDGWLGTSPWMLIIGGLLGMATGFYTLVRRVGEPKGKSE